MTFTDMAAAAAFCVLLCLIAWSLAADSVQVIVVAEIVVLIAGTVLLVALT